MERKAADDFARQREVQMSPPRILIGLIALAALLLGSVVPAGAQISFGEPQLLEPEKAATASVDAP